MLLGFSAGLGAFAARAEAQFTLEPHGSISVQENVQVAGKTRIRLTVSGDGAAPTVYLRRDATSSVLEYLIVTINTPDLIRCEVTGPSNADPCASISTVDFLTAGSSIGDLIVSRVRSTGDVSFIRAHGWNFVVGCSLGKSKFPPLWPFFGNLAIWKFGNLQFHPCLSDVAVGPCMA